VTRNTKHALAAALVAALAVGTASIAASTSADAIKERQQAMEDVGGAMKHSTPRW
jgi:outer membrane lipoprotein-sorting protein